MPRVARQVPGGLVYHVLNRGVGRMTLFEDADDYEAFERVMVRTQEHVPGMRVLGYCLMPNHWHLVLWPRGDRDTAAFMQRLTITHVRRWLEHRHRSGMGHVYQGRYKSFPVERDEHLLAVLRYVERNPLRAQLVRRAEDWRWGSLWRWVNRRKAMANGPDMPALTDLPVDRPRGWNALVNDALSEAELKAIRTSVSRGRPYGGDTWSRATAKRLALQSTLRPRGRPRKDADNDI